MRPPKESLLGKSSDVVPLSLQRIVAASSPVDSVWIGPKEAKKLSAEDTKAYSLAHDIMKHLAIEAPRRHKSGHPGGPLSAFAMSYGVYRRRRPGIDAPLRMSPGHLSVLAYGLQYLCGRDRGDKRLASPQAIIDSFRTIDGLPGHVEAGIGDIPFGTGPLGKGLSNGLGHALGWMLQKKPGVTDVLESDGSLQEGQSMEAMRLASRLGLDHLIVHADANDIQLSGIPSKTVACDLAAIFQSAGWAVIEVQNGNDPMQVEAALDAADGLVGKGQPIFICYYTTMGYGITAMEKASDAGSSEYHGAPMKDDLAASALSELPSLEELVKAYEPIRRKFLDQWQAINDKRQATDLSPLPKIKRILTTEKGAVRKDLGAVHVRNLMSKEKRIIVLHADLAGSGGFDVLEKEFPGRIFNCGVMEANMYMMAAGLRQAGMLPITYTFAAFGTNEARASARLIDMNCGHTACGVVHDCTHAGLSVGEDGETHQERNYLNIPFDHTQVWVPADSNQGAAMAEKAFEAIAEGHESVFLFSGRAGHPQILKKNGTPLFDESYAFEGQADLVHGAGDTSDRATILSLGAALHESLKAAHLLMNDDPSVQIRVLNIGSVRPIDAAAILQAALETLHLVVVEDHNSEGGLSSRVADIIADFSVPCTLRRLGIAHYFPSGPAEQLQLIAGFDAQSIQDAVLDEIRTEVRGGEDVFVTCIHSLFQHKQQSRFAKEVEPFLERLLEEEGYLESLRAVWRQRTCPVKKLPKNEELRRRLRNE